MNLSPHEIVMNAKGLGAVQKSSCPEALEYPKQHNAEWGPIRPNRALRVLPGWLFDYGIVSLCRIPRVLSSFVVWPCFPFGFVFVSIHGI